MQGMRPFNVEMGTIDSWFRMQMMDSYSNIIGHTHGSRGTELNNDGGGGGSVLIRHAADNIFFISNFVRLFAPQIPGQNGRYT
jgi:hypothetical protein